MAEMVYKYEVRGVAYLDIVGFTSKVKDARRLQELADALASLETMLAGISIGGIFPHMFSDTIVITFTDPSRMPTWGAAYLSILQVYSGLQGLFVRGGIAVGDHYEQGSVMFGPAYLDAFELEKLAVWPRVLIHPDVLRIDPGLSNWANSTVRGDSGLSFLDYLHKAFITFVAFEWIAEYRKSGEKMRVSSEELFRLHRAAILKEVKGISDLGVLTKYHALATYQNSVIRRLVSMFEDWASSPGSAARSADFNILVDLFMVGVSRNGSEKKAGVDEYVAIKIAKLPEQRSRLEDGIIDVRATFPALDPASQKG